MSNRRMFSKKIITSAKFLKMPLSTQALYFHLGLNADDDGVVEAFPIIRVVGSSDDDFKILLAKQFIIQLNDEQVCFITDWLEHNTIRADRKVDSIYKDLLIQSVDNIKLIESKPRSDRQPKDSDGTVPCQSGDGLSKDKLSKVKISKDKKTANADFDFSGFSGKEIESINDWLQYKKERNQSYKTTGLKTLRKKMLELSERGQLVQAVDNSISNNYAGLYENKSIAQATKKSTHDLSSQPKTAREIANTLGVEINDSETPF